MYLVINKCVTAVKVSNFSGQYLRNHWTFDIGVLGYIGIVWPKKHSPEVWHIPPGTPCIVHLDRGMQWCSWLRHCATSRQVACSIPDGIIGIFHWHNPSGHAMALGMTQSLTEMSTRNITVQRADNLTTFTCWLFWNMGISTSWNPQGLSWPVMGLLYLLVHLDHSYPWIIINMLTIQYLLCSCIGQIWQMYSQNTTTVGTIRIGPGP